jgi:hypothetical protein
MNTHACGITACCIAQLRAQDSSYARTCVHGLQSRAQENICARTCAHRIQSRAQENSRTRQSKPVHGWIVSLLVPLSRAQTISLVRWDFSRRTARCAAGLFQYTVPQRTTHPTLFLRVPIFLYPYHSRSMSMSISFHFFVFRHIKPSFASNSPRSSIQQKTTQAFLIQSPSRQFAFVT